MTTKKSKFFVIRESDIQVLHYIMLGKYPSGKFGVSMNGFWSLKEATEKLTATRIEMGYGIYDSRLDNWVVKPEGTTK